MYCRTIAGTLVALFITVVAVAQDGRNVSRPPAGKLTDRLKSFGQNILGTTGAGVPSGRTRQSASAQGQNPTASRGLIGLSRPEKKRSQPSTGRSAAMSRRGTVKKYPDGAVRPSSPGKLTPFQGARQAQPTATLPAWGEEEDEEEDTLAPAESKLVISADHRGSLQERLLRVRRLATGRPGLVTATVDDRRPAAAETNRSVSSLETEAVLEDELVTPDLETLPQKGVVRGGVEVPDDSRLGVHDSGQAAGLAVTQSRVGRIKAGGRKIAGDDKFSDKGSFLFEQAAPQLTTVVAGPKRMKVGYPATFLARVRNVGAADATGIQVRINIPQGAQLLDSTPSTGDTSRQPDSVGSTLIIWHFLRLDAGFEEELSLQIMPSKGGALELAVQSSHSPVTASAIVEVQQPQLAVVLAGPEELRFGQTGRYNLTISNPGTGDAEKIVAHFTGMEDDHLVVHHREIGILTPGASQTVEWELLAREAGPFVVEARAVAEGGLKAEESKEVLVIRPDLQIGLTGPTAQYAGTTANYDIILANLGTATADSVMVSAALPQDARYVSSSDGGVWNAEAGKVTWQLGSLPVDGQRQIQFLCKLRTPGQNRLQVISRAATDVSDAETIMTEVIAVADLKLDVTDPPGPIAVGEETSYEIRLRNEGNGPAEAIDVVAFFSEGLEPVAVEGMPHQIGPGQVVFEPINTLVGDREVVLRIIARAGQPGNHVFRVEVGNSTEEKPQLAAQETTLFYESQQRPTENDSRTAAGPTNDKSLR